MISRQLAASMFASNGNGSYPYPDHTYPNGNGNGNGYHTPRPLSSPPIDPAEIARRQRDYAVYPIIPRREITLISGPPRVGTTTLLTMICESYRSGKPVLGFPTYAAGAGAGGTGAVSHALICFTHTRGVLQRICSAMGVLTDDLNLTVMGVKSGDRDREKNTFAQIVKRARKTNPELSVIFLDGYHRLFRGNRKDYDAGADGTDSVQEVLEDENITLVAVGRSVKVNADNLEASPMERFYGSVSTTERVGTFISMERLHHTARDNPKRVITIETQHKPLVQQWEFTNTGLLVPETDAPGENRTRDVFNDFESVVMARGAGEAVTSEEMNGIGRELGVSTATVARYRNRLIERGKLEGHYGEYKVKGDADAGI